MKNSFLPLIFLWFLAPAALYAQPAGFFPIQMPVIFNGQALGTVDTQTSVSGTVLIEKEDLLRVLAAQVGEDSLRLLEQSWALEEYIDRDSVTAEGLSLTYDAAQLALYLDIAADRSAIRDIRLGGISGGGSLTAMEPAFFSMGTNFNISQEFVNSTGNFDKTRRPLAASADGFMRIGRDTPIYLRYGADFQEYDGLERTQTTLFFDQEETANRYAFGDITPLSTGFQDSLTLGGVSLERLYSEIQPFRRTLPSGRSALILDRRSEIDVRVNNVLVDRLTLDAGRYDIRDFPLIDGLNQVELTVRGPAGQEQILTYDFFSDTQLLDPGLSQYSFALGKVRTQEGRRLQYDGETVASGFYERGVSHRLTLGAYGQFSKDDGLAGIEAAYFSDFGLLGLDFAASGEDALKDQYALELSYTASLIDYGSFLKEQEVDLIFETRGRDFSGFLSNAPADTATDYRVEGRYSVALPDNIGMSLGISHNEGRNNVSSSQFLNLNLSKYLGWASLNISADVERLRGGFEDGQILASLSVPLGFRNRMRYAYDTDQNRVSAEWDRLALDAAGEVGGRVFTASSQDAEELQSSLNYVGNRFTAELGHDHRHNLNNNSITNTTRFSGQFGLAFADGKAGIGRDVLPGFILADTHENLKGRKMEAQRDGFGLPFATSGFLGSAVIPVRRGYSENRYTVSVNDLPPGYNLGSTRLIARSQALTGYKTEIGQAASITVIASLKDYKGVPVAFVSGKLIPSGDNTSPDQKEAIFFTNRTGRLVADSVAPGNYQILFTGQDMPIKEITVPKDVEGLLNIGEIQLEEPQ